MKKSSVWMLVAAGFALNAAGLLWIRSEVGQAGKKNFLREDLSLQVVSFEPAVQAEKTDLLQVFLRLLH